MNEKRYYAIYSRKSKFTGKGESIENQIELCKSQLTNKYGREIEEKIRIYQDEGFTGYNTNRPEFQKMLKDIRANKIQAIIVYRLDRVSRNVSDFCNLKDELAKYNVDFISVSENFDTSTPMGIAMLMITSVFAQLERDTIAERIRDNMYELAKTGRWLGGNTPLGFQSKKIENIDIEGKKRSLYQLDQIPDEIKTIQLIWDKMDELKGLSKLESYLLQQGIKTRNHNNFTRFSLISILKNPVYVVADKQIKKFFENMGVTIYADENDFDGRRGLIAYNKRLEIAGKPKTMKNISEWIIAVGKHHGVISSDKFIKVWNLLDNNKNKRFRTPPQNNALLSGIIKCKYCGSYMRPRLRNSYTTTGKRNFSYLCELKDKSRKQFCQCRNINGTETDHLVVSKVKELTVPISDFITKLQDIVESRTKEPAKKQNELQSLKNTFTNNKMKLEKLVDKLAEVDKEIMTEVIEQIKSLKNKNSIIKNRISELENEGQIEVDEKQVVKLAFHVIQNYMDTFEDLDIVSKRTFIKSLISSVESDGENLYIHFIGSNVKCP